MITVLKSKMQNAIVTEASTEYRGSLTLDPLIMGELDLREFEQVHVNNKTTGNRDITYIIEGEEGSGVIGINGALALRHHVGDHVHILAYKQIYEAEEHIPLIV